MSKNNRGLTFRTIDPRSSCPHFITRRRTRGHIASDWMATGSLSIRLTGNGHESGCASVRAVVVIDQCRRSVTWRLCH